MGQPQGEEKGWIGRGIGPMPCHPGKDQNISDHIVLAQNVCVV